MVVAVVAFLVVVVKTELSFSGTAERVEYLSHRADGERTVSLSASVTVTLQVRVGPSIPASITPEYDKSMISKSKGSKRK